MSHHVRDVASMVKCQDPAFHVLGISVDMPSAVKQAEGLHQGVDLSPLGGLSRAGQGASMGLARASVNAPARSGAKRRV